MLADEVLGNLTARARRFGARPALHCNGARLTFEELDDRVSSLAGHLAASGIGGGDVVSLYAANSLEWVVAYHAILRSGAIVNPINALLTNDEVAYILRDCRARLIVSDRARTARLREAGAIPDQLMVLAIEDITGLASDGAGPSRAPDTDPAALSTICYTSGTTGRPKGAMLSHRSVLLNAGLTALMHGRCGDDTVVSPLPLPHVYGNVVMNSALIVGAALVVMDGFTAEGALAAIAGHRASVFDGVPTMYYRILDCPELATSDLSSMRLCAVGGQSMSADKMAAIETRFGVPMIELWGMSEIAGLGTTFPWTGPRALGSIGVPLPGMQVRIFDPAKSAACADGTPGELQFRGDLTMLGYLGNSDATREVLSGDGWLSTGDVAFRDGAGRIFIVDRSKDVILTSGNNVYPAEIERAILALDGVAMVGVGRDSHSDRGEVPHAYVVLSSGAELTTEDVLTHCRKLLAPYKLPRAVTFVVDLPKTSSGKIMRRMLSKQELTQSRASKPS